MSEPVPRKLLIVGGEDVHLRLDFIRQLTRLGLEVAVTAPCPQPALAAAGIKVFQYPLRRTVTLVGDWRAMRVLRRIVANYQPDIVHAFDTKPTYLAPLALIGMPDVAVVRTITGLGRVFSTPDTKALALQMIHWTLHMASRLRVDHTVFQNTKDEAYFRRAALVRAANSSVIRGSGIDAAALRERVSQSGRDRLRKELGLRGRTVFVMVARLVAEKGVFEYLEAARRIRTGAGGDGVAFLLVGPSGRDEPGGVPTAAIEAASDHVAYLGRRDDVPDLLTASDVFVLPTKYREGVPRAMLEAMALSRPVVVTDVQGCDEAVRLGHCGFLARPGDVDSLEAMLRAALHADLEELGVNARKAIGERYAMKLVIGQTMQIYDRVTGHKRGADLNGGLRRTVQFFTGG